MSGKVDMKKGDIYVLASYPEWSIFQGDYFGKARFSGIFVDCFVDIVDYSRVKSEMVHVGGIEDVRRIAEENLHAQVTQDDFHEHFRRNGISIGKEIHY